MCFNPKNIPENQKRTPRKRLPMVACCAIAALFFLPCVAVSQQVRFSDPFAIQSGAPASQPATFQGTIAQPGQANFPPAFQSAPPPITSLPPPNFIQPQQNPGFVQPQTNPGFATGPGYDPFSTNTTPWPVQPGTQPAQAPFFLPPAQNGLPPPMSFGNQPAIGSGFLQNNPQGSAPNSPWAWPGQVWTRMRNDAIPRLLERPRFRQTWLAGGSAGNDLDILDTEIATTITIPGPQNSLAALRISPGFIFHFLNGPDTLLTGYDLPAQMYSIYAAADLATDPRKQAGLEANLTVGAYTDFQNLSTDSIRLTGTGLGWVRVNPYTVFKLGVEYYDRVKLKMLPAFGFFMQPNNEMKIDLYFPRPRISHRMPGLGNFEIWGYVGAEYGGGSWAIERLGGMKDQVDINDVRAFMGYEWAGPKRVTGFIEAGYVFDREILYRSDPTMHLGIPDTIMVRTGFAF